MNLNYSRWVEIVQLMEKRVMESEKGKYQAQAFLAWLVLRQFGLTLEFEKYLTSLGLLEAKATATPEELESEKQVAYANAARIIALDKERIKRN